MPPAEQQEYLDSVQGLRQMASELGVPVVPYKPADVKRTNL
jgi:hypothetical protein